jgi:signal transduction histidine kinase
LPIVHLGAPLLEQVLNGLVANAIQSMAGGGAIEVTASMLARDGVELRIADRGHGMTAEQLAAAFLPFHTTKPTGLGLGLPLARRILERHGASIDLTSVPGRGTAVVLHLPAARRQRFPAAA